MYFRDAFTALLGLSSLVAAVPTNIERNVAAPIVEERDLGKRTIVVNQIVQETSLTVLNLNLDVIDELTRIAETSFALLIQSQLALASQLQAIKNNIRINHFKHRFAQVNTVVVTVSCVVDLRESGKENTRYLVNQLLADNGFPERQLVVMVTDAETMTISATPTSTSTSTSTSTTGIDDVEELFDLFGVEGASLDSLPTAAPILAAFDRNAPYGAIGQSVLLPFGIQAPTLDLVFEDPANIIFPQSHLFVESPTTFLSSCNFYVGHANAFVDLTATFFSNAAQIAAAQLRGIALLGGGVGGHLGNFFVPTVTHPPEPEFTIEIIDDDVEDEAEEEEEMVVEEEEEEEADVEKDEKDKEKME